MAENRELSPKQRRAIVALLNCKSIPEAAGKCGTPERTLYRWLGDPDFKAELQKAEDQVIDQVARRLLGMQEQAIGELGDLISGIGGVSPALRLRAVQTALEYSLKYRELKTLEERLQALEMAVQNGKIR